MQTSEKVSTDGRVLVSWIKSRREFQTVGPATWDGRGLWSYAVL